MRLALLLASLTVVLAGAVSAQGASSTKRPWLWQCEQIGLEDAKDRCYVRMLLLDIEASGDPADELPRIDLRARATGTSLLGRCHMLMHQVGRRYAVEHHVTLENLQRYVPRSNDPGCSAGFGMGLVMALGPEIIRTAGRSAVATCLRLPTRYRSYTCIHSLGHALMRGYHETLWLAVNACRKLGQRVAPDCVQGAFHDYWISLRGADETTQPAQIIRSPRVLCGQYFSFARQCWYRYFVEQAPGPVIASASDLRRVCRGLRLMQRSGCIAGASLDLQDDPFEQTGICSSLATADLLSCLRGVGVQALAGKPRQELELVARCGRLRAAARWGCYEWYGLTLDVVTNGRFRTRGCLKLRDAEARAGCLAGARRSRGALVTFS
ncbi:MAG: hypothetical protein ABR569_00775 [Gaiellaceae bacterium]